ncbi:MAG: DUF488 domain-containing protein [Actinomycetota bacterium]
MDAPPESRKIFTLGTSTRTREEFLDVLAAWGIRRVCDVRSFPTSRRFPHFSRETLSAFLEDNGIEYLWMGELLGGYRKGGYQAHMEKAEFREGIEALERAAAERPTAVLCAELLPWKCHRRFIASVLESRGWEVVHVLDVHRFWKPKKPGSQATFSLDNPPDGNG